MERVGAKEKRMIDLAKEKGAFFFAMASGGVGRACGGRKSKWLTPKG